MLSGWPLHYICTIASICTETVRSLYPCCQIPLPRMRARLILYVNNVHKTGGHRDRLCSRIKQETSLDPAPRSPNGFLSSLAADDFELIRQHLRTADLVQEHVLVEFGDTLKRAYMPHKGVISLVVRLARGENVQVALVGRDSIFGSFSAIGDATALNSAVVLVPGVASTIDLDRLRAAA